MGSSLRRFSYDKKASSLRGLILGLVALLGVDAIVIAGLALIVPGPWKMVVVGGGLALSGWGYLLLTGVLRTHHTLDEGSLRLAYGRFRLVVPLGTIAGARHQTSDAPGDGATRVGRLSGPTLEPVYRPEDDALYILPDRHRLVAVDLSQTLRCRIPKQGPVEFTRIVLSLDEPESFLAALEGLGVPVEAAAGSGGRRRRLAGAPRSQAPVQALDALAGAPAALEVHRLVKRYGDDAAVRGLSLVLRSGEVLAFLGSNGAGKTTTLRMIAGLLRPTSGRVRVLGRDVWDRGREVRRLLGYVPDVPFLHEWLTAREFLWLVAGLYGLPRTAARQQAEALLERLSMESYADQLIRTFSLGMKRKTALAAALMHHPKVLLLDEVTNGLDPRAAREVRDLVAQLAREGTAVLLATHHLDVAEGLAHRIAIIDGGSLCAMGSMDELRQSGQGPDTSLEEIFLALTTARGGAGTGPRAEEVPSR
ncbi:ABC transporter ATP-binding protein [Limnochorda pilosa]|uniref:ABC transporter ATP-binding protein n=1 Tax=Limnochorda pilosa TaxID=1555112 RepID=A0A0K2SIE1_LIMPI|nr:ABC transporter ATP-binding protein [Limnochorda pilosa]BAS26896.1 ABC transporter ATP-binding protein [Limnochorda pilosa]